MPIVNEEISMDAKTRSTMANILGVTTVVYLVFLWTIVLNPLKWKVSFPGGLTAGFLTMLLAVSDTTLARL
jgi:F0F1-type ATP synthase assembly protein I